ncbi:MAG: hypothetical protein JSW14_06910 [Candidatus Bathyarchaeum sp.]|nr:MAG: hypothetical protein JSW14_06910 [Candidatus Bathyarchaeum sp.]
MQKRKRLALLSLLLLVSVVSAVVAQASGVLQSFTKIEEAELNIQSESVSLMLTPQDREKVTDIVLMDPQIQELLEDADEYSIQVSEVFDVQEISGGGIALVPKEGVAEATIEIHKDYGDEFSVQVVKATAFMMDEGGEVTEIEIEYEVCKRKVHEGILFPSELIENPLEYDGVIVTVTGKVSLLGEVFGSLFMLDETVTVFYNHEEATVDVSNIENGDSVKVKGIFRAPDTIYALEIEKN